MTGEFSMFAANDSEAVFEFSEGDGSSNGDAALIQACDRVIFLASAIRKGSGDTLIGVAEPWAGEQTIVGQNLGLPWMESVAKVFRLKAFSMEGIAARQQALIVIQGVCEDQYDDLSSMTILSLCKDIELMSRILRERCRPAI